MQYVDLGTAIALDNQDLAFDGMHLTAEGNARLADLLTEPVLRASARVDRRLD